MKDPAQGQSPDYSHLWWTHGSPEGLSGGLMAPLRDSLVDSWFPWGTLWWTHGSPRGLSGGLMAPLGGISGGLMF